MITIYLNDEAQRIEPFQSMQDFLDQFNQIKEHFAVALNNQVVPRQAYKTTLLYAHDRVDVIVPMQGG